ncbi:TolC family protein [Rubrolithibacter danxiaensis]|uniref:TolC family protein n=1 Tax=Rubrolithibacter danxiaensis TaxID=3390805 RepID=UPI003BF88E4F
MKRRSKQFPVKILLSSLLTFTFTFAACHLYAQDVKQISLQEAITAGITNSKTLKISQARIEEAVSRFNQARESGLPEAKASLAFSHANFLSNRFKLPGSPDSSAFSLPSSADAYIGTMSVQQLIFAGNKLRYAKESTDILTKIARLNSETDKEDITYNIINAYYNLYKVEQSEKVVQQNLKAIDEQISQAQKFFNQGIVTKNDVLRFQLQRSNTELTAVDLETNRKIVTYNLDILLGYPENTNLHTTGFISSNSIGSELTVFIDSAVANRTELKSSDFQVQLAEKNIKTIQADYLPTLGVGANLYYINPSSDFFPAANTFLAPVSLGATLAWNIDKLWTNKQKIREAKIQKSESELGKSLAVDNIKIQVNQSYQNYKKSLEKIKIVETSVEQAQENDRILESKYRNNIATATDRIDAQTQLYQALINLELAKADATLAYYTLLKSTGTLNHNQ